MKCKKCGNIFGNIYFCPFCEREKKLGTKPPNPKQTFKFDGKDAYENFCEWTNEVNLQKEEIKEIIVTYHKRDEK